MIDKLKYYIKKNIFLIHFAHKIISLLGLNFEKEYKIIKFIKKKNIKIFDVGAHLGESIRGFQFARKNIKIFSFEPNYEIFLKLKKKFKDDKNIIIYNDLLMDIEESFDFYVPKINNIELTYMGSTFQNRIKQRFDHFFDLNTENLTYVKKTIKSKTIDQINVDVDLIKIDTEGSELQVLIGSQKTIIKNSPILIIEFNHNNFEDILSFMKKLGYKAFLLNKNEFIELNKVSIDEINSFRNQINIVYFNDLAINKLSDSAFEFKYN